MSAALTHEQLVLLLEEVSRENPKELQLRSSARFQDRHDDFCRALARRLVEALADGGYAWARVPQHGDGLYKVIVAAIDNCGGDNRFGLSSDNLDSRLLARHGIATEIGKYLESTKTAVVRRKAGG